MGLSLPTFAEVTADGEQLLTEQLGNQVMRGAPITLTAGDQKVFAIFSESVTGSAQGGAILLHDSGANADWPAIVQPLRLGLPQFGWSTLALQLPLNAGPTLTTYNAALDQIFARIKAAADFMRGKGINNIVIIGDGMGAIAASAYAASAEASQVKAFIAINMGVYKGVDAKIDTLASIEKITMPMLDIFGTRARIEVTAFAEDRAIAAKKAGLKAYKNQKLETFKQSAVARTPFEDRTGYIAYRQMKIMGANSAFIGMENLLLKRIVGWLRKHAPGVTVAKGS